MEIPYYKSPVYKQPVVVNFAKGLDTKTDPYQVNIGNFLALNNSVFTTGGRLTKRNGFANITTLPNKNQTTLTTFNGNLLATGSELYAYNSNLNEWLDKGTIQPVSLNTAPLVRKSTSQSSPDSVVAANGLICIVYTDSGTCYYQVLNSKTGQQVVADTAIASGAKMPRVALLGSYFVITYTTSTTISFIGIPTNSPSTPSSAVVLTSAIATNPGYDILVVDGLMYVCWAYSSTSLGLAYVTPGLSVSPTTTISSYTADYVSLTADTTHPGYAYPIIYISIWDSTSTNVTVMSYTTQLVQVLAPTTAAPGVTIDGITSQVVDGVCTILIQVQNYYSSTGSYPTTGVQTDYIQSILVTSTGTITGPTTILRGVGLASKCFSVNKTFYTLVNYGSLKTSNQPAYFLIDVSGNIYMRLAYSNGGGYAATQVLPTPTVLNGSVYIPYLVVDLLATVNKQTALPANSQVNAIYTQTGINLATFQINTGNQFSSEVAGVIHLTGGQLWEYDGVKPVEHGFHVWPENIQATWTASPVTPTGTFSSSSTSITVSSATGIAVGMSISDTTNSSYIPSGTVITAVSGTTLTISQATTHAGSGDTLSISGKIAAQPATGINTNAYFYQFTYEWTDNAGNLHRSAPSIPTSVTTTGSGTTGSITLYVPTLRLTYKISPNPVRIVGYRWSAGQQNYYQFTSIVNPVINNTTIDYVTLVDVTPDSGILGNNLIYTTGGVVEDIAAPASIHSTMWQDRLILIDAEDQNLLWYSKQIIEATPVEMTDLFTIYVAPTIGSQGSTGPLTALAPMDDKLVLFKQNAIYYITGIGPDNTGANSTFTDPIFITTAVGCSNPNSIILTPNGLMFQSDKGIWLLGRDLSTNYIGAPVEGFNSETVESAQLIPNETQVRFILGDNVTLMFDYYYNQWGTFSNIQAISGTLYNGYHTYLSSSGHVYQETPGTYLDGSTPVLMAFTTSWMNVANLRGFQRIYYALLLGTYHSPFKLNVQFAYDYGYPQQAVLVSPDNYSPPYGGDSVWGGAASWGGKSNVFQARVFPQKQKCETFQISVQEIFDPTIGVSAGQGLSFSGMNLVVGVKRGFGTQRASRSFG